ncbi:MAG: hypothetical protein KY429_07775 [Actinobacteria bacterium]|nr:hypothetical protein [Actinomycetota bacterium]
MRRPRELKSQQLAVRAPAPLPYEVVSSAGKTLESRDGEKTVEFELEAAGKKVRTVELVVLDPPMIKYRWLEGPLPFVEEEIEVVPRGDNSELRYQRASRSKIHPPKARSPNR